jgi:hypothetical protein
LGVAGNSWVRQSLEADLGLSGRYFFSFIYGYPGKTGTKTEQIAPASSGFSKRRKLH